MAKGFQKGYIPWNKEKHLSKEHRKKIKNALKNRKVTWSEKVSKALKGKPKSEEHRKKLSEKAKLRIGELNPNWKGGITEKERRSLNFKKYTEWRLRVFQRDNFTCQGCGQVGNYLNTHHIKNWKRYPALRFDVNNGITLCWECHKKIHNYNFRL